MLAITPGALRLPLGPLPGPAGHPPLGEGFFTQSPKRSNTSTMANYREEHIRNNRRLARQVVGAAALLLALIGLFTVLGWIVGLVRAALDDTDLRNEYRDRLYGMVMLDPVAFDDVPAGCFSMLVVSVPMHPAPSALQTASWLLKSAAFSKRLSSLMASST